MEEPQICIGITTRSRPRGLRRALESIEAQDYTGAYRVVVVDNDPAGSARWVADTQFSCPVSYHHEAQVGIPYARNAVVAALQEDDEGLAFIDDDEVARPNWLRNLVATQRLFRADAITGPVEPYFPQTPPRWVLDGEFFARRELRTGTEVREAYTHNLLLTRSIIEKLRPLFDERMARRGGSDAHFAGRLRQARAKTVWCQEAVCIEWIPRSRTSAQWLLRRSYRQGANRTFIEQDLADGADERAGATALLFVRGVGKIGLGGLTLVRDRANPEGRVRSLRSIAYGVGLLAGMVQLRYDEYDSVHEV